MWWTPTFLQRSHHLTVGQVGELLGPMHLIAGTLGTLLAGWLVGRRAAADPRYVARLLAGVTALTTIPSIFLYWVPSQQAATAAAVDLRACGVLLHRPDPRAAAERNPREHARHDLRDAVVSR